MSAYSVPRDEEPAAEPDFNLEVLSDSRGWLTWAPELVLGVDLADAGSPQFSARVRSRLRQLQRQYHPDKTPDTEDICKILNISAGVLSDHGAAYLEWSRGGGSDSGPLQVARAALLMPPALAGSFEVVCDVAVPLLEKGLETVERLQEDGRSAKNAARSAEAAAAAARREVLRLKASVADLERQLAEQQKQAADQDAAWQATLDWQLSQAERRRAEDAAAHEAASQRRVRQLECQNAQLAAQLAASERRRAEDVAANQAEGQQRVRQLTLETERLTTHLAASERVRAEDAAAHAAELQRVAAELSQRPAVNVKALCHCLTAVTNDKVDRRCRRDARRLLTQLGASV